jgi:cobalt-zinc-cadmium efflux system outer membrane protein
MPKRSLVRLFARHCAVLIFAPISLTPAAAQAPLDEVSGPAGTVQQATAIALTRLPEAAAAAAAREQVAAQRRAARGLFVGPPLVSGDLEIGNEGVSEQEAGVEASFRWPGEGRAGRLAADRGSELIDASLEEAALQVAGDVRAAWWALASARAVVAVERAQAQLADQEVAATSRLVEAGVQARRDLLLAQAERSALDARVSAAETELLAAEAAYIALAGPAPMTFPPEELAARGAEIDQHPAVRAALARVAAAEARASVAGFGSRPRIEGRLGVRRERVEQIDGRDGYENALLIGIGVPIGRDYSASAEAAGARSEALRAAAEAASVRVRLVADRLASDRRLELTRRAVSEAEARQAALAEALTLTERGRREGEIGYVEVLRARQTVAQATRDLAVARIAALAAISTFNQAQGKLP